MKRAVLLPWAVLLLLPEGCGDGDDRPLTITTYGIPWYSEADLAADPAGVTARTPAVVSRFRVSPK